MDTSRSAPCAPRSVACTSSSPGWTTPSSSRSPTAPSGPSPRCCRTSGRVRSSCGAACEDVRAGRETPDDFAPSVWDEWNAKTPRAQADDALAADEACSRRSSRWTGRAGAADLPHGATVPRLRRVRRPAAQRARVPHLGHRGRPRRRRPPARRRRRRWSSTTSPSSPASAARPDGEERTVRRAHHRPRARLHAAPVGRRRGAHRRRRRAGARRSSCPPRPSAASSTAGSTPATRPPSPVTPRCSTRCAAVFPGP